MMMTPTNSPRQRPSSSSSTTTTNGNMNRHNNTNGHQCSSNKQENHQQPQSSLGKVSIVGGGLVGSMATCFLARRGYQVELYEMREDPRQAAHVAGKSINLALSERGRSALRSLGLEQLILDKYSIKMRARMIHDVHGNKRAIPYGKRDQYILSVGRRFLNELLITEAEKYPNVKVLFNHKMVNADLANGQLVFQDQTKKSETTTTIIEEKIVEQSDNNGNNQQVQTIHSDIIIGCDGAYSAVRRSMIKLLLLDYSQKYIEHGYIELCIPPTGKGQFAMEPNYLHIWPRGTFMMIALPNLDRSFTVTLFMPFKKYDEICTEAKLFEFFEQNFVDSIDLLTKEGLAKSFFGAKPSPLISIKCNPYNYKDKVLLMGDAAHAMVPFYGQGMNCGFEDCIVLEELLEQYGSQSLPKVLDKFTTKRVENCHTIIDLAMYNYVEMRDLVNRKSFLLRKMFDNLMYTLFPSLWIPLYTMVTFTRIPYRRCMQDRHWQDEMLSKFFKLLIIIFVLFAFVFVSKQFDNVEPTLKPSSIAK